MAAQDHYVTTTGATTKTGATWATAMDFAAFEANVEGTPEAGDRFFIMEGTYTLTSDITIATSRTYLETIELIGVKSGTSAEPPTDADYSSYAEDDRPVFACGAYVFTGVSYNSFKRLEFTGTASTYVLFVDYAILDQVKITNAGTGSAASLGTYTLCLDCEIHGSNTAGKYGFLLATSVHACRYATGYHAAKGGDYIRAEFCSFKALNASGNGLEINAYSDPRIINCNFYGCGGAGLLATTCKPIILNCNFVSCGTGFSQSADDDSAYIDYCNWWDNTSDLANASMGPNDTEVDPEFVDAAGGDFSLAAGSACLGACPANQIAVG